jgi:hypothetical protein
MTGWRGPEGNTTVGRGENLQTLSVPPNMGHLSTAPVYSINNKEFSHPELQERRPVYTMTSALSTSTSTEGFTK